MTSRARRIARSLLYFGSAWVCMFGVHLGVRLNRDGAIGRSVTVIVLAAVGELVSLGLVFREIDRMKRDDINRNKDSDANG